VEAGQRRRGGLFGLDRLLAPAHHERRAATGQSRRDGGGRGTRRRRARVSREILCFAQFEFGGAPQRVFDWASLFPACGVPKLDRARLRGRSGSMSS